MALALTAAATYLVLGWRFVAQALRVSPLERPMWAMNPSPWKCVLVALFWLPVQARSACVNRWPPAPLLSVTTATALLAGAFQWGLSTGVFFGVYSLVGLGIDNVVAHVLATLALIVVLSPIVGLVTTVLGVGLLGLIGAPVLLAQRLFGRTPPTIPPPS